jgi:hypothetical protein
MRGDQNNHVLRYGSRKASKLVRCYWKRSIGRYRVEIECHSGLLHKFGIWKSRDLAEIERMLYPGHIQFIDFDWQRLESYLDRKLGSQSYKVLRGARKRDTSVQRVARYLRRRGVHNVHRLYRPVAINNIIERALRKWSRDFNESGVGCAKRN